jgi:septal ring factor EnvC (AmiA/AmiB activator)
MRSWVAQLDRRLGIRTYIFGAMLLLSIAASVLAIVLAVDARDNSASDDDINSIEDQLATIAEQASGGTEVQSELDSIDLRLSALEDQQSGTAAAGGIDEERIAAIEADIEELQNEVLGTGGAPSGAGGDTGSNAAGGSSPGSKP